jgi:uncharacterized membrane protein
MRTPASISKHPIHPMLIVFPIGLWVFSLACDLIRLAGAPGDAWITVAYYSMVGGFIGALCGGARTDRSHLLQGRRCARQENRSDPHDHQSYRCRSLRDKYLAACE